MKTGLAGLVLGMLGLVSNANAASFRLPAEILPELHEPYAHLVGMLNDVKQSSPGMKSVLLRTQDRKRLLNVETHGYNVLSMTLVDPPYAYHSVGLYGQLNDVEKEGKFYVINKIGQDYKLPIHPLLIQYRIMEELVLLDNPIDSNDADTSFAIMNRNALYQKQFELLMHSLYAEKDLLVTPVFHYKANEAKPSSKP